MMAATSRPDLVDVALLRPGRIDKSVYCGFPSREEREEIVMVNMRKFNYTQSMDSEFVRFLSERTEGFTSADIKGLF